MLAVFVPGIGSTVLVIVDAVIAGGIGQAFLFSALVAVGVLLVNPPVGIVVRAVAAAQRCHGLVIIVAGIAVDVVGIDVAIAVIIGPVIAGSGAEPALIAGDQAVGVERIGPAVAVVIGRILALAAGVFFVIDTHSGD